MFEFTDPLEQLNEPTALNKYKTAGLIATKAVNEAVKNLKEGSKLMEIRNHCINYNTHLYQSTNHY